MIDYMVMEAVAMRVRAADEEEAERQKREDWKRDRSNLEQHR